MLILILCELQSIYKAIFKCFYDQLTFTHKITLLKTVPFEWLLQNAMHESTVKNVRET